MYLKSLELHGFKSFPNRTVLTFERGATVIVGPNGSGKSNISDAMRWVLGEARSRNIRGTVMEDVIFGGTDDRRPMGFAEVSVTFDNTDPISRLDSPFDEVTVTRRYYRTGESEYLINKESKRLRDIQALFMNTGVGRDGYSIIGQGKVQEIISKKSDDRRTIFEEAAGISKYRHRKEEAERKLKSVSENLDRINDIRTEIEGQVVALEKDADKARRGLEIYERKKRADVSLWLYDTEKIRVDVEQAANALTLAKRDNDIIQQVVANLEARYNAVFNRSQEGKLKSGELLEEIRIAREKLHELDNAMRAADSDFAHSADLIDGCLSRIDEIERSEASVLATKDSYMVERAKIEEVLQDLMDERLDVLNAHQQVLSNINKLKVALEDALLDLGREEESATDLKIRIDVLHNTMDSDGEKSVGIEEEIARFEEEGILLREEAQRCEVNASGFRTQIDEKDAVIASESEEIDRLTIQREQLQADRNTAALERDAAIRRADDLQRMVDHFDGYIESVKFVMREYRAGKISGAEKIYGPLSSLISVDKEYITAIETALGASLQNIVVDNENTAKAAIKALKNAGTGRATFYPITAIRPAVESDEIRIAKKCKGFIGRADTLVNADSLYRSVVEFLLLRTLVFDNIDNASTAAKQVGYKVKIVTLDGQVINAGGSFTGGSAKRDSGILTRTTEISTLKARAESLDVEVKEYETRIANITARLDSANETLKNAEQEKELLLTLSRSQFAALDSANAKYDANRRIVDKFKEDYETLVTHKGKAAEEILLLSAQHAAVLERIAFIKENRSKLSEDVAVLDEKRVEVEATLNEMQVKVAEARKDLESIDTLIAGVDSRLNELSQEKHVQNERITYLQNKRKNIDSEKSESQGEYERLSAVIDELQAKRIEIESDNDEFERELNEIRQKERENTSSQQTTFEAMVKAENALQQLTERQTRLGSQLWDDYEITYEDAVALEYPAVTAENRDEVVAEQTSCKNRLRSIGSFDPESIEKYAEVKTRYDYLNTQFVDLTKSQEELVGIIARIENEMRTSFVAAFNDINRHFGITFRELFGGGNAELSLTDPEDVLLSGIEIKAAPPGKIIKSMSLLSGGEQSFVAIALLFAILKVNPTPFCIFDEVEAALDEVNVYRFGEYVRKLGEDTQFILITHRRGTMEIGDRLYGVTMPQNGISQAIELNVNEIESKQKELLDGVL